MAEMQPIAVGDLANNTMSKTTIKGGVKGGHSVVAGHPPAHHFQQAPAHGNLDTIHGEEWPKGLANVGNTCYANATLQCLMSTALTNALLDPRKVQMFRRYSSNPNLLAMGSGSVDSDEENNAVHETPKSAVELETEAEKERRKEREQRKMQENCQWLTQELTIITRKYTTPADPVPPQAPSMMGWLSQTPSSEAIVDPGSITRHPDRLSKCLRPYQQEDAHEFLRALLGTLVMNGHNKQLSSLFDGLLESAVICRTCGRENLTRDRYMDLSLDINTPDIRTLEDALLEYTKTEILEEDNAVFCQKCNKKQSVTKGLRLATAPSILVCHLKRFAFDHYGRLVRLHKKIAFPERLHIGDYMSHLNKARPPPYDLVGILVHQGQTCASGHYLAFVKKDGEWYRCNDSVVTKVDEATVMDQQAYILMYEVAEMREKTGCTPRTKAAPEAPEQSDEDSAEFSKDDVSTNACSSMKSSEQSRYSSGSGSTQMPTYQRLFKFLWEAESVSQVLNDFCCDGGAGLSEPRTHELKRTRRRKNRRSRDSQELSRTLSTEQVKVIERKKKNSRGFRAQTAPRQRTTSYEYSAGEFDVNSPRTSVSVRSDKGVRRSSVSTGKSRPPVFSGKNRDRSRSIHNDAEKGLPPLPTTPGRHRRGGSNSAGTRKMTSHMIV